MNGFPLKGNGKKKINQSKKHILFFDFLENYYVPKDEVSKNHLNVIKKSNFVKEDKTIISSIYIYICTLFEKTKKKKSKCQVFYFFLKIKIKS